MAVGKRWAGSLFGTNFGNVYIKFDGEDTSLTGIARFADSRLGIVVYELNASFDGNHLKASGSPQSSEINAQTEILNFEGVLDSKGNFEGEWSTSLGAGGTFVLYPKDPVIHSSSGQAEFDNGPEADQLYTKRHTFGAIEINQEELIRLGDRMQANFVGRKVIVTIVADTEQSKFLDAFRLEKFPFPKASISKLFVQEPEVGGVNRTLTIEFGPSFNFVIAQSSEEAWALGTVERFKREILPFERSTPMNIYRSGIGVNQLLIFLAAIFIVDIPDLSLRILFLAFIFFLIYLNNLFQTHSFPMATIRIGSQRSTIFTRFGPSFWSWFLAASTSLVVTVLGAFVKWWFSL